MSSTPVDPQFVLEHAAHVRALAARLVFERAAADDLEQETWLAALRNAPSEMTSPRGWLARIAQRRAGHDWRAESARQSRERVAARPEPVASSAEILEREETRTELVRAVLALDEPYRSALVAQFLEERTPRAAARRRGVPVETQRTHVKRGLELLRARLKRAHGAAFGAFQVALVRDLRIQAPLGATLAAAGSGIVLGGLSMWTAKKVAAVVLVAAAAWLVVARPWGSVDAPLSGDAGAAEIQLAGAVEVARPAASAERASIEAPAAVVAEAAKSGADAPSVAGVVVVARVVDENGRPIAGASGKLASWTDSWNETTPRSETFRGTTGDDGVLRIEAPPTTSAGVELTIDAGPWRTRIRRTFEAENLDRLVPGTNEAGELMLRPAGRVRGRVTVDGAPVADSSVEASSPVWTGATMATNADRDGRFVIDSIDPSVNELRVTVRGFTMRLATVPVVVQAGVENDVGEIALQRAPTIEGRVTDAHGEPLAGVVVGARQANDLPRGVYVTTAADGTFVVRAPEAGDYDLSVTASQFVRAWASNDTPAARFASGELDARIVLERVPVTTFRVIAEDGAPVLEFGLGVRPIARIREMTGDDGVEYDEQWPRIGAHGSNEVVEPAEPGLHEVFVAASGFVPHRASVAHDRAGSATQTLRLERGRALRGRVVRGNTGLASAQVVVERAWVPLGPAPSTPGSIEVGRTHAQDVAGFPGRSRSAVSGADGTFEFTGLPAGTYDVRVALGGDVVARAEQTVVRADADRDLGDVVVRSGATVRGVLDAGAQSPIGWTVSIRGRADLVVDRADGRFEFTGLESGVVELTWYHEGAIGIARAGLISPDATRSMQIELVDGATRDVRIDVANLVPVRVSITARVDGAPLADAMPMAVTRAGEGWQSTGLGSTRADGRWTGLLRPGIATTLQVTTADGLLLASTEAIVFAPGEQREIVIDARTGLLAVRLPDEFATQSSALVRVDVRPVGMPQRTFLFADWRRTPAVGRKAKGAWSDATTATGRVGEGTWTARVEVFGEKPTSATSSSFEPLIPAVEREITIRAGETTVFDLR